MNQSSCSFTQLLISFNVCLCKCDGNRTMPLKQIREGLCLQLSYSLDRATHKKLPKCLLFKRVPKVSSTDQPFSTGHHWNGPLIRCSNMEWASRLPLITVALGLSENTESHVSGKSLYSCDNA